jgi:GntR family transcriptional regulator
MTATPPLQVSVDLTAATPPYEQIRVQVAAHIAGGALGDGDRLPTVRVLAADLGVATNTVARAYRELEAEGMVTTRRRTGTTVTVRADGAVPVALARAAETLATQAVQAGLTEEATLALVRGALLKGRAGTPNQPPRSPPTRRTARARA